MKMPIFILLSVVCSPVFANTITIDFDDIAAGTGPEFESNGYTFIGAAVQYGTPDNIILASATDFLENEGEVTFHRSDSSAFALYSVDSLFGTGAFVVSDSGNFYTEDFSAIGAGAWLNMTQVTFYSGDFSPGAPVRIDNVVVGAAVPIPATAWLLISALTGLGWLNRKNAP